MPVFSCRVGDEHGKVEEFLREAASEESLLRELASGGEQIKKGSWVKADHVKDVGLWKKIESGEIDAFSIGGTGKQVEISNVQVHLMWCRDTFPLRELIAAANSTNPRENPDILGEKQGRLGRYR